MRTGPPLHTLDELRPYLEEINQLLEDRGTGTPRATVDPLSGHDHKLCLRNVQGDVVNVLYCGPIGPMYVYLRGFLTGLKGV